MTQLLAAKAGKITSEMETVARSEGLDPQEVSQKIAKGEVVIPANKNHKTLKPRGIGAGLKTKVNANIGTSSSFPDLENELTKLKAAVDAGADAVMDLSTGGDLKKIRKTIIQNSPVPVGTVPIYQAGVRALEEKGKIVGMTVDDLFGVIEEHARDGVDFVTVHCGVTMETVERLKKEGRVADVVSRGGSFIIGWMLYHEQENPLFEHYDRLLEIALEHDVTLSLGDGFRPGCLADATDRSQIQELIVLGELVDRARDAGVQVMVEGPGHVPINEIKTNIQLQKKLCHNAPFYVLGPVVTDVAPGYDHISAAIGGALAASFGADFLCYVTPAEHLGLPGIEDVREGVIAARIAAHAADVAKGIQGASEWDKRMAIARKNLDWKTQIELAIDPEKAKRFREDKNSPEEETCTMCGEFCAMKFISEFLGKDIKKC